MGVVNASLRVAGTTGKARTAGHELILLGEEKIAPHLFTLISIFKVEKANLEHKGLGPVDRALFQHL